MLVARDIGFAYGRGPRVLEGVSLTLAPGEIVGLSGPSGGGKSTLGRLLAGHLALQSGTVTFDGAALPADGFCPVQYLGQSPVLTVNPRWRVGRVLGEAWAADAASRQALGVEAGWDARFPHELSGGQLQRVAVLRALAPGLRYLVADEISAMLDAITQVEIWQFLSALARERGIGILAISHDRALLDRIAVRTIVLGRVLQGS